MINIVKTIANGLTKIGLFLGYILFLMILSYLLTYILPLNTRDIFFVLCISYCCLFLLYSLGQEN